MSDQHKANFDVRPPVPVHDYLLAAHRINVGYELAFELVTALLRAHCPDEAHLLLIGAGGGTEVRTFGRAAAHWRLTGVDPSENMLALARASVNTYDLADRATSKAILRVRERCPEGILGIAIIEWWKTALTQPGSSSARRPSWRFCSA
jgi:hypothetical protein